MKQIRILIPLLFLTVSLFLPNRVQAQPKQFSANEVIAEVNALRLANRLSPYVANSTLMIIAQAHAEYMASSGIVTHYSLDGSRPYQRALDAGYSVAGDLSRGGFFSENIHSGANLSASAVVEIWQGDSAHLNTMISTDLKDIGVGIAIQNGITYYVLGAGLSTGSVPISTSSTSNNPFSSATETPSTSQPVATTTPDADGSVYHIVQSNEALWSIALAYNTSIDELKRLNGLATDEIFIGQTLLISKKEVETLTPEPTITVTFGIPTSTATKPVTPSATFTATPVPTPPASRQSGIMIVGGIVAVALFAAALGSWLGRKKIVE